MKSEPLKGKQRYYLDAVKIHHDKDIKSAVGFLKSEPMSLCLDCHTRWNGLIDQCKRCGAEYSKKPYKSRIEYYIHYEDVDEAFEDVTNEKIED